MALQVTSRDGGSSDWNKGTQAVHVNINYTGVAPPPGPAGSIALERGMWPSVSSQFCELGSQINGISCDQALQRHGRVTYTRMSNLPTYYRTCLCNTDPQSCPAVFWQLTGIRVIGKCN